jgi:hypothetical protein
MSNAEKKEYMRLLEYRSWKQSRTDFIHDCIWTIDEADKGSVKRFPAKDYLARVDDIIGQEPIAAFPKSRRMMMTWRCLANLLWEALFLPNQAIFVQSKKFDDSAYLLGDNRLMFMYHHLPEGHAWPAVTHIIRGKRGYSEVSFSNGSTVYAVSEGPDQLRQYTASHVYCTEMAFWDWAEGTWNSLRPTIEGGGKITIDSSANPGFFCRLVTGDIGSDKQTGDTESHDTIPGVHEYRRNGAYIARIHYTADPDKRSQEWKEKEKAGATAEGWEREYEINWIVSSDPKYYPEFCFERHVAQESLHPLPGRALIRGWDYGLTPATVIAQTTAKGQIMLLSELQSFDCGMRAHGRAVIAEMAAVYPGYIASDVGDPAGNQRSQTDEKTANELLSDEYGIYVEPGAITQTARSEAVRYYLTTNTPDGEPLLLIDPSCTMIIEAFTGGYHRKTIAARVMDEPEKNEYSHLMDCIGYLCAKLCKDITSVSARNRWKKAREEGKLPRYGRM